MAIIKNFGFLWERKNIFLGSGGAGNAGHLFGYNKNLEFDFRDQIGVYILYDKDENIVYVGQAGNGKATLFKRLVDHTKDHLWNRWEFFTWIGFKDTSANGLDGRQKVESNISNLSYSDALDEIEGILIEVIEPKLNKQSGQLKNATEFFQSIDSRLTSELIELKKTIDEMSRFLNTLKVS